ncbi:MAG: alpha amylase C-terminal domain-containing protein, partial [Muribaculaceae bacterium]|nr:alpha amylase C-terminal domain-containing protein [Muribaculaceae bacterium]
KHTQPVLRTGDDNATLTNLSTTEDATVYAYKRTSGDENMVVMLNFGDEEKSFKIPAGLPEGKYRDVLSGATVDLSSDPAFTLPALDAAVFVKE